MPQRPGDAPCRVLCVPGLHPGPHALFQIGDDLVGDAGVNVLPGCAVFGHGLVSFVCGFSETTRNIEDGGTSRTGTDRGTGNTGAEREWSGQPVAGPAPPARNVKLEENRERRRDQTMTKAQPGGTHPRLSPERSAGGDQERGPYKKERYARRRGTLRTGKASPMNQHRCSAAVALRRQPRNDLPRLALALLSSCKGAGEPQVYAAPAPTDENVTGSRSGHP